MKYISLLLQQLANIIYQNLNTLVIQESDQTQARPKTGISWSPQVSWF